MQDATNATLPGCAPIFKPLFALTGDTHRTVAQTIARAYLGPNASPKNPQASPLFASDELLRAFPPCLLHASTTEQLRDDSARFAERLKQAGGTSELWLWRGKVHVWPSFTHVKNSSGAAI